MSATFRRKTHAVEAIQFNKPYKAALDFCVEGEIVKDGTRVAYFEIKKSDSVLANERVIRAFPGDYILKYADGTYKTYQPHVFEQLYEEIGE